MKLTTFQGIVENGQVRLPANVRLPEKAKVYVVVPEAEAQPAIYIGGPHLRQREQAAELEKEVIEETPDASV